MRCVTLPVRGFHRMLRNILHHESHKHAYCTSVHATLSVQPLARSMAATGQRSSTIRPNICTSARVHAEPLAGETRAVPSTRIRPAVTGPGSVIGSDSAPRSSRSATMSSKEMLSMRLCGRGHRCRATKCAVAVSHPSSAATKHSTGCGAESSPPALTGSPVRSVWPVLVMTSQPERASARPEKW